QETYAFQHNFCVVQDMYIGSLGMRLEVVHRGVQAAPVELVVTGYVQYGLAETARPLQRFFWTRNIACENDNVGLGMGQRQPRAAKMKVGQYIQAYRSCWMGHACSRCSCSSHLTGFLNGVIISFFGRVVSSVGRAPDF